MEKRKGGYGRWRPGTREKVSSHSVNRSLFLVSMTDTKGPTVLTKQARLSLQLGPESPEQTCMLNLNHRRPSRALLSTGCGHEGRK